MRRNNKPRIKINPARRERIDLRIKNNGGRKNVCAKLFLDYRELTIYLNGFRDMPMDIYNIIMDLPLTKNEKTEVRNVV